MLTVLTTSVAALPELSLTLYLTVYVPTVLIFTLFVTTILLVILPS